MTPRGASEPRTRTIRLRFWPGTPSGVDRRSQDRRVRFTLCAWCRVALTTYVQPMWFAGSASDVEAACARDLACVRSPGGEAQRDFWRVLVHLLSSRARGRETRCGGIPSNEGGASARRAGARRARLRRPERGRVVPVWPYLGTPEHTEQEDLRSGTAQASRLANHLLLHRPRTPGAGHRRPSPT
jgi:hypothetical protein